MYRVKAVAEMLDVSVATIYRAIQARELDAYKLGTGKSAVLRIPGHAIRVYLERCGQAAYDAFVTGDASAAEVGGLSAAQAEGRACVVCNADFLAGGASHVPVGRSGSGSQVFACLGRCEKAAARDHLAARVEPVEEVAR